MGGHGEDETGLREKQGGKASWWRGMRVQEQAIHSESKCTCSRDNRRRVREGWTEVPRAWWAHSSRVKGMKHPEDHKNRSWRPHHRTRGWKLALPCSKCSMAWSEWGHGDPVYN